MRFKARSRAEPDVCAQITTLLFRWHLVRPVKFIRRIRRNRARVKTKAHRRRKRNVVPHFDLRFVWPTTGDFPRKEMKADAQIFGFCRGT
ncbi:MULTISPECIES: hypothetical protein [unclassified Rhizobium]|jgi:hypothetical protein|uniref:hypothetical protein n=1 Tax=unclassified Rhizobium TaxID=2613769 RepID=UPI0013AFD651|nr:hypothetical protein [Rhizobium sp. UBA1881]